MCVFLFVGQRPINIGVDTLVEAVAGPQVQLLNMSIDITC